MKQGRKFWLLLLSVLFTAIIVTACGANPKMNFTETDKSSSVSDIVQLKTVQGTACAVTSESLTLIEADGAHYRLPLSSETTITNTFSQREEIPENSIVSVSFYGDLIADATDENQLQNVRVIDITVTALPEDSALTKAKEILSTMSLEEKVGQMFIVRCPEENAPELAEEYQIGGYLLFGRDFENQTPSEMKQTIQTYQNRVKVPLFIGVDEEGGSVVRASAYSQFRSTPFASPQELYAQGGMEKITQDAAEKSKFLLQLGINLNFAPVCDVCTDPDSYMYDRSFGKDAKSTANYVSAVVKTMKESGICSVLKHFPGYGENLDTHTGIAYDERSLETFETSDFLPFQSGIAAGADCVLVSHNIVTSIDAENPASLSAEVHGILREDLGFDGIILTDDLAMDAIRDSIDDRSAAVAAVQAGNDLLCCTDFEKQIPAVIQAVKDGKISEDRLDESVLRILKAKIEADIIS